MNARTITNSVRKALRSAGLLERTSTQTQEDLRFVTDAQGKRVQVPVYRTLVTVKERADETRQALIKAGFDVTLSDSSTYVFVYTDRTPEPIVEAVPEPATVADMVTEDGRTVAEQVGEFRALGVKARAATHQGRHEVVPGLLADRVDIGKRLVRAGLLSLTRYLFAEQQDLVVVHPHSGASAEQRVASRERLAVARSGIDATLAYPAPTAPRPVEAPTTVAEVVVNALITDAPADHALLDVVMAEVEEKVSSDPYRHLHEFDASSATISKLVAVRREAAALLMGAPSDEIPYPRIGELFDEIDAALVSGKHEALRDALIAEATHTIQIANDERHGDETPAYAVRELTEARRAINRYTGEDGSHLVGRKGTFDPLTGRGTITGVITEIGPVHPFEHFAVATLEGGHQVKVKRTLIALTA